MKTQDIKKMGLAYVQVLEANKKEVDEALVGNQHKIDANKNGKVDAHDFKLLRKGKKVAEEAEQVDEVLDTFAKGQEYRKKANASLDSALNSGDKATAKKRDRGLDMAYDKTIKAMKKSRMTKEEVEELDELSKNLLRKVGGKMLRKGLSDDPKATKHMKSANLASAKLYPDQYKNSPLNAKVPATESTEWPVFKRIQEKSDKYTVKYNVSGVGDDPHQITMKFADPNHVKGATKPEAMDDKWSEGEKKFVELHGGLDGNDSGIHGHKAAAHTAKAATMGVKTSTGRHNDSKIGDKTMPKPKG